MKKLYVCICIFFFFACSSSEDRPDLKVSPESLTLSPGQKGTITVGGGRYPYESAVSSNPGVATASLNGENVTVTGVAGGSAVITIHDGDSDSKTVTVTVGGNKTTVGNRWVSFGTGQATDRMKARATVSTTKEVVADFEIPGMNVTEIIQDGVTYQALDIPGAGQNTDIGKPQVPSLGYYVAVPVEATAGVEILASDSEEISGYTVYPAQEPPTDIESASLPPFTKDSSLYRTDAFYPASIFQMEGPFTIRGYSVIILRINPVQFNPAKGILKIFSYIQIRTSFIGGQSTFTKTTAGCSSCYRLCNTFCLNKVPPVPQPQPAQSFDDGTFLLIIT